jgi:uncharacterized protein YjbI with pentapeptide repeats
MAIQLAGSRVDTSPDPGFRSSSGGAIPRIEDHAPGEWSEEKKMKVEIKHRFSGSILFSIETDSLKSAVEEAVRQRIDLSFANLEEADLYRADLYGMDLHGADLRGAHLYKANLSRTNLSGADLSRADLSKANLYKADLTGADLSGAGLYGAIGVNKYLASPLQLLRDQPGKIRAYKLVTKDGDSPMCRQLGAEPINYRIGSVVEADKVEVDEFADCGAGINLATLDWCLREWRIGYRILIAEFESSDIAAIPIAGDGKFRVTRCKIVGEKTLEELGLPPAETH